MKTNTIKNNIYEVPLQFFNQPEGYVEPTQSTSNPWNYVYQYKDHLGNIRLSYADNDGNGTISTTANNNEIVEENNYYPFGLKHKGYNMDVNGRDHKYEFQGEEMEEELGKNTVAYQWRDYDPAIARFNKIDRFAEKYVSHSTYVFTKNNPVVFKEIKGDSINLAAQYQQQFRNVLQNTFGDNANNFKFDNNGNLTYSGSKKDFKGNDKKAFKALNKLIKSDIITDIVFEETINFNGNEINVDDEGGELTILASKNEGLDKNLIAVNPNAPRIMEVPVGVQVDFQSGTVVRRTENVITNATIGTFHGIGHVINEGKNQTNVIVFDNLIRSIQKTQQPNGTFINTPLPNRPDKDLLHSQSTINTQYE